MGAEPLGQIVAGTGSGNGGQPCIVQEDIGIAQRLGVVQAQHPAVRDIVGQAVDVPLNRSSPAREALGCRSLQGVQARGFGMERETAHGPDR